MSSFHLIEHGTCTDVSSGDSECGGDLPKSPLATRPSSLAYLLRSALKVLLRLLLLVFILALLCVPGIYYVTSTATPIPTKHQPTHTASATTTDAIPQPRAHTVRTRGGNASAGRREVLVSLQQACAVDMTTHCAASPYHHRGRMECLLQRYYTDKGGAHLTPLCRDWLDAREACAAAVRRSDSSSAQRPHHLREQLRTADPFTLPDACVESDYYTSVILFGMLHSEKTSSRRSTPRM